MISSIKRYFIDNDIEDITFDICHIAVAVIACAIAALFVLAAIILARML